jgi:hypothetical protein
MEIMQQCYKDKKCFEYILYNKTCSVHKKKISARTWLRKCNESFSCDVTALAWKNSETQRLTLLRIVGLLNRTVRQWVVTKRFSVVISCTYFPGEEKSIFLLRDIWIIISSWGLITVWCFRGSCKSVQKNVGLIS